MKVDCAPPTDAKGLTPGLTQNQLIELFETDQLKGIVERSEERGWVDPAELEAFVAEAELGAEELEQATRELEAMGLEATRCPWRGCASLRRRPSRAPLSPSAEASAARCGAPRCHIGRFGWDPTMPPRSTSLRCHALQGDGRKRSNLVTSPPRRRR